MEENQQKERTNKYIKPKPVKTEIRVEEKVLLASSRSEQDPSPPEAPFSSPFKLAKKPDQLAPDWIYKNIQEITVNCRKLFFIYLALLGYAMLSAVTTPIENLFLGQNVRMPIINTTIPILHYLVFTPILSIGFFVYNQLYLRKVNELIKFAIDECKAANPDCDHNDYGGVKCTYNRICHHHQNRLYPWIIIFGRYPEKKIIHQLQVAFISFSLWFFLPCTLITITFFIMKKHDHLLFFIMLMMTTVSIGTVLFFWNLHCHPQDKLSPDRVENKNHFVGFLIILLLTFFTLLHIQGRQGRMWWVKDTVWGSDSKTHNELFRALVFVNLRDRQLVKSTSADIDYSFVLKDVHFEGADLSFANLKKANFKGSHFQHASLRGANLRGAELSNANFYSADLSDSKLIGAILKRANLKNCDLSTANLEKVDFTNSDLQNADLNNAILKETIFTNAKISFADFRGVESLSIEQIKKAANWKLAYYSDNDVINLGLPEDHCDNIKKNNFTAYDLSFIDFSGLNFNRSNATDSNLSVSPIAGASLNSVLFQDAKLIGASLRGANLSEAILCGAELTKADLTGAILCGADLSKTNLMETNLQWADLRGVKGITVDEIKKAVNFQMAYLDKKYINQLGLANDHNFRLKFKNLSAYSFRNQGHLLKNSDLMNINFKSADFRGANLKNVNFSKAYLYEANLADSDLKNSILSGANLYKCNLKNANILWSDFRGVKKLSLSQIKSTRGYQLAKYDSSLLAKLNLPDEHNDLLDDKNFKNYKLNEASLMNAQLNQADLRTTELIHADLRGANLSKTLLRNANLADAKLDGANLEKANLRAANLEKANLTDADLQYADMVEAKGIDKNQLSVARNFKLAYYSNNG